MYDLLLLQKLLQTSVVRTDGRTDGRTVAGKLGKAGKLEAGNLETL